MNPRQARMDALPDLAQVMALLSAIALGLAACSGSGHTPRPIAHGTDERAPIENDVVQASEIESSAAVDISIEEQVEADRWRVRYTLEEPAVGVMFTRNRNHFRARGWTIVEPDGARWQRHADSEAIVVSPGDQLDQLVIELETDLENKSKDYNQNFAFTDGGRLLYTGHLVVRPLRCATEACEEIAPTDTATDHAWHFVTDGDRHVALLDDFADDGELEWYQPDAPAVGGTYAYFGPGRRHEANGLSMIVDPGLPKWMAADVRETLPALFDYYRETTGFDLDFEPLVLVSFGGVGGAGTRVKGGTLDGLMQLDAAGAGWAFGKTEDAAWHWRHLLAHEAFHMWNFQRVPLRGGQAHEWLSEGSAELMALHALRALGHIDDATRTEKILDAANACITQLRDRPLMLAHTRGRYRAFYSCGLVALLGLEGRAGTAPGVLIGDLLRTELERDGAYSTWDLVAAIEARTGHPTAAAELLALLQQGIDSGIDRWVAARLADAGLDVGPIWIPELTSGQLAEIGPFSATIAWLDGCDCERSGLGAWLREDHIELKRTAGCSSLHDVERIDAIGGVPVTSPGRAFVALHRALLEGEPIEIVTRARATGGEEDATEAGPADGGPALDGAAPDSETKAQTPEAWAESTETITLSCGDPGWHPPYRALLKSVSSP